MFYIYPNTYVKKLILVSLAFLLLLLVIILKSNVAHAYWANPNSVIPNGSPGGSNWYYAIDSYNQNCQNYAEKYWHVTWLSGFGTPTNNAQTNTVAYGTRYVALQFNQFAFVCHDYVNEYGSFPYAFLPDEGSTYATSLTSSEVLILNSYVASGGGSLSQPLHEQWSVIDRTVGSRYWTAQPLGFTYDAGPGGLTSSRTITINVDSMHFNNFFSGSVCVANGQPPAWFGCPVGTDSYTIRINVAPPPPPPPLPTVDLRVNGSNGPINIAINGAINLTWSTANATSCTASNAWSGSKNASGGSETRSGPPHNDSATASTRTYRIGCSGPGGGPVYDQVTVNIIGPPSVQVRVNGFTGTAPAIEINGGIVVTWTSTNASGNCTASGTWSGSKSPNNSSPGETRSLDDDTTGTKTYSLTCTNSLGQQNSSTATISVVAKPYVQAFLGDVSAGDGFMSLGCNTHGLGDIKAFNNGSPNYTGSGGQLAVTARGSITEFVSSALRSSLPLKPKGLSFADGGTYGGNFGGINQCIDNYWEDAPATDNLGPSVDVSSLASSTYKRPGNLTIDSGAASMPINNGTRIVLYVDGNVTINKSITYPGNGTWTMGVAPNIPSLWIIARGNIYISNAVTELNGVYMALPQPNGVSHTGGTVYTCSQGTNSATMASSCGNSLTVYGAVVAQQLKLLRTYSTLRNSVLNETYTSTQAAERFIFSPEVWLRSPLPGGTAGTDDEYDNITSLPPIL